MQKSLWPMLNFKTKTRFNVLTKPLFSSIQFYSPVAIFFAPLPLSIAAERVRARSAIKNTQWQDINKKYAVCLSSQQLKINNFPHLLMHIQGHGLLSGCCYQHKTYKELCWLIFCFPFLLPVAMLPVLHCAHSTGLHFLSTSLCREQKLYKQPESMESWVMSSPSGLTCWGFRKRHFEVHEKFLLLWKKMPI